MTEQEGDAIGDAGAEHIRRALEKNSTIATMWIGCGLWMRNGCKVLVRSVSGNGIGVKGINHIVCALEKNTTVTEIGLSGLLLAN